MFCPIKRTTRDSELGKTISKFGIALLHEMDFDTENVFFSPAAIAISLSMVLAGAGGETRKQMLDVLKCGRNEASTHKAFTRLVSAIDAAGRLCELYTANCLYGMKNFEISQRFLKTLASKYQSDLKQVDFADGSIRSDINNWVANVTQEKIRGLIPEGLLSDLTRLLIVSGIYFKGKWSDGFSQPFEHDFYGSPYGSEGVEMMRTASIYLYTESETCQAIQLPYQDDSLCMVIILPKEDVELSHVIRHLSGHTYLKLIYSMQPRNIMVYLPEFSIEASYSLSQQLARLDLGDMFSATANFTRITTEPVGLYVSEVVHKAAIQVTGEGTFGNAATSIAAEELSGKVSCHDRIIFKADHPFMFSIFHRQLKCPLFYGVLVQPAETGEDY